MQVNTISHLEDESLGLIQRDRVDHKGWLPGNLYDSENLEGCRSKVSLEASGREALGNDCEDDLVSVISSNGISPRVKDKFRDNRLNLK